MMVQACYFDGKGKSESTFIVRLIEDARVLKTIFHSEALTTWPEGSNGEALKRNSGVWYTFPQPEVLP